MICPLTTTKTPTRPWPPKPPSSSARTWIIWSSWLRAKPRCARTAASSDASRMRAFPCSKPSMISSGVGPKRSTASKSRTYSVWPSSQDRPTVGLAKTRLSIALGRATCLNGQSVLFTTAVDIINALAAAQSAGRLKREFHRYLKPAVLIVDELGYLPIDKHGADLLFQIISQRYERAPMVITTNRAYKHWSQIFNNDSTLTSAILDRVLHHADTVVIEGKSFRMKDEIEE